MQLMLTEIAKILGINLLGEDRLCKGVNVDSRQLLKGDLFVALKGEKVDGHSFIKEAEKKGSSAVMVSEDVNTTLPVLKVSDPVQALGKLAKNYRDRFNIPIIAVTGSCGKTSVKEMLLSILKQAGNVLANQGNLNTEIGVPLTLFKLNSDHQMAIIEMGARKKGDIAYLMSLASPKVTLITNAGVAHVEIFGSEKGIAEAKGEIYQCLDKNGTAVINADDPNAELWRGFLKGQKVFTFGLEKSADITCSYLIEKMDRSIFELVTNIGKVEIKLKAPGRHNIMNALAAAAGSIALGVSLEHIQAGLNNFVPVTGRLQNKMGLYGARIIDDTYNANPVSVLAALKVLANHPGPKICVLGDMKELGAKEIEMHREIGVEAKKLGIGQLLCIGELTKHSVSGFGLLGSHFKDKEALIAKIRTALNAETAILVKGSRSMKMEEVVYAIVEKS